jgi:hypothetical protein
VNGSLPDASAPSARCRPAPTMRTSPTAAGRPRAGDPPPAGVGWTTCASPTRPVSEDAPPAPDLRPALPEPDRERPPVAPPVPVGGPAGPPAVGEPPVPYTVPPPFVLPPLPVDSTEIGAFAPTGALRLSTGARPAPPTCRPPDEPPIVGVPSDPPPAEGDCTPLVPPEPAALPPLLGEATLTGAFAVTGADADVCGAPLAGPTCAVPVESPVDCPPVLLATAGAGDPLVAPEPAALPPLFGEATLTGASRVVGAVAAVAGETPRSVTCAAPVEPCTDRSPEPPPDALDAVVAPLSPVRVALPPLCGEATLTGALPVAGADAAVSGEALTAPTCAEPVESPVDCPPPPVLDDEAALAPPPPELDALPPLCAEATLTGALTVAGADAAVAGEALTAPTCAEPVESPVDCPPALDDDAGAALAPPALDDDAGAPLAPPPPDDAALPPLFGEATLTGALTVAGADAAVCGAALAAPTWAAAVDWVTS